MRIRHVSSSIDPAPFVQRPGRFSLTSRGGTWPEVRQAKIRLKCREASSQRARRDVRDMHAGDAQAQKTLEANGLQVRRGKAWGLAGAIAKRGSQNWQDAWDLLKLCIQLGVDIAKPDTAAFNAALTAVGGDSRWAQALGMLTFMRTTAVLPNIITMGGVLRSLSRSEKNKAWQQGSHSLQQLTSLRLQVNVVVCNTALAACRFAWLAAVDVLAGASLQELELDIVSLNSALAISVQAPWSCGVLYLRKLHESALVPDAITANSRIQLFAQHSAWRWCLVMLDGGWQSPNSAGLNIAINGLANKCKWQKAWAIKVPESKCLQQQNIDI